MQKPLQLKQQLIEQIPFFQSAPEKLVMTTGAGNIVATSATSLSFEYRYTLTLSVSNDNAPDESLTDQMVVAILDWLRVNQPEILGNVTHRLTDFTFVPPGQALLFTLQLTERVQVDDENSVRTITHLPEPPLPDNVALPRQVYLNGELISSWTE
ncbi:phage tail protein [Rahnella selenatireducens]|uniref:phage tail protein n=1 Tax=Rahnella selenatireducens TaxID=3389797 RepID=UPI0039683AD2